MKVRQRVYLAIDSDLLSPSMLTDRLGMEADRERWKGSTSSDPPRPACHSWILDAGHGRAVDVEVAGLLDRVALIADRLRALVSEPQTTGRIQVVRELDHPDGEDEEITTVGPPVKVSGQHQLLGFHLDLPLLQRLVDLGVSIDVDEYG